MSADLNTNQKEENMSKEKEKTKIVPDKDDRAEDGEPESGVVPLGEVTRIKKGNDKDEVVRTAEKKGLLW